MTDLHLTLGRTRAGAPVIWSGADNPHIAVSGRSGSGKSYFLKGLLEQAAQQKATCLVLDYSGDFPGYRPPEGIPFRRLDVSHPDFRFNPLAHGDDSSPQVAAQRLLTAIHNVSRIGARASLSLQTAALEYLEAAAHPSLRGLADFARQKERPNAGLAAALEPLDLLAALVRCGEEPISLDLTNPGISVLSFDQILNTRIRSLLVELLLGAVWAQRSSQSDWTRPLILLLDECQNLSWGEGSMAVRILREGRKRGLAGWFSSQYITQKTAAAALGQAALQAYFRPDDANIPHLARSFSQAGTGSAAQWSQLIRNLKVGQFLLSNGPGNHLVVTVPQRRGR